MINPVRTLIDTIKATRKAASAQEDLQRLAAQEAAQLELVTLETFARLTERLAEAKEGFAITCVRMGEEARKNPVADAAATLDADWKQFGLVISRLASAECLARNKDGILQEMKRLSIGAAEANLKEFGAANAALLKRHGVIS